jgi:hypothetical protein
MSFSINLSERTYQRLLHQVNSFEDTPEEVIRRLLDAVEAVEDHPPAHKLKSRSGILEAEGGLLAETEYWLPILQILAESDGVARGRDVIDKLEDLLGPRLMPRDRDVLTMGEVRWRNRARFARLRMKEQGLISSNSPRGIWEITEEGRGYLNARLPR